MGTAITRLVLLLAALAGFSAVSLGAFGAHALSDALSVQQIERWNTATFYLLVHAGVALSLSISPKADLFALAGLFLIVGAIIFAATLYTMALGAPRWLGAITPIGGIGMVIGWALTFWHAARSR